MTDLCPDCGRPKPECERCVGGSESRHDAWRELQCAKVTVDRLRRELAEANHKVEAAEWHVSDYDAGDSAALHDLRAAIDDRIGWKNETQQEAGDYLARLHEVANELAEARAIGELEREFLNAALVEFEGTVERDETGAVVPMTTELTELHVFNDREDWYVAHTIADAEELRDAHYGEARPTEMRQVPDGEIIGILCDELGEPDDGGEGVDRPASDWAKRQGRGYLCSRDF